MCDAVAAAPYLTRFPSGEESGFPDTRRYGFKAVTGPRREADPPLVWLTMGTVNSGFVQAQGTWAAALDALSGLPVRAIASTGRGGPALRAVAPIPNLGTVDAGTISGLSETDVPRLRAAISRVLSDEQ